MKIPDDVLNRLSARPAETRERSLEELFDDLDWWHAGGLTDTGSRITPKKALGIAPYFRGVKLIADTVAKIPCYLYRRKTETEREKDSDHPAARIIGKRKPNKWMTAFTFKQTLTAHAVGRGNGYAWIERDENARPIALYPLSPGSTRPIRHKGELYYITSFADEKTPLAAADVLHIKGLGYDALQGYSVLSIARETLGIADAARSESSNSFKQGLKPDAVLEHPGTLKEPEKLRVAWQKTYAGSANRRKTIVLEEGMKLNPWSISAADAQLLETRKFDRTEIALFLGLQPHKVGDDSRTSYASLEQENQAFLDDSIDPWLVAWEEEITAKLLTQEEIESETHFAEFLREVILRADTNARINSYRSGLQFGWLNRDEVRAKMNLPPIPDSEGKKFFVPANWTTSEKLAEPKPQPPAAPTGDQSEMNAIQSLSQQTAARMIRRLMTHAKRAAKSREAFDKFRTERLTDHAFMLSAAFVAPAQMRRSPSPESLATTAGRMIQTAVRDALEGTDIPDKLIAAAENRLKDLPDKVADLFSEDARLETQDSGLDS